MARILLIGSAGQLGQELAQTLPRLGTVIEMARQDLDIAQPDMIRSVVDQVRPDVIVNAAAYTAVDKAEAEPELAHQINAIAPKAMAEAARPIGALMVQISTEEFYAPQHERTLRWDDDDIGIQWPVEGEPVLSDKDRAGVPLRRAEVYS